MDREELTLNKIAESQLTEADATVSYSDSDIIMIDNIRLLTEPSPNRLQMNMVVFCCKGKANVDIDGTHTELAENRLLVCPPNTSFTNFMLSPEFEFNAIFVTNRILQTFLREKMTIWTDMFYIQRIHVITIDEEDIALMNHFFNMLRIFIYSKKTYNFHNEVMQSFLSGAFLCLCGLVKGMQPADNNVDLRHSSSDELFQQFLELLGSLPVKHRPVEWYADELCVSPKYLTTVCKNKSGKTAIEWIREQVLEDIRYNLKQTDLSIKQICNKLGFPNPSFFGKYVKEHFGMPPAQLRYV